MSIHVSETFEMEILFNFIEINFIFVYRLLSYAGKTRSLDDIDESLVGELTEVEKFLLKSQDLMKVRGKVNATKLHKLLLLSHSAVLIFSSF